MVSHSRNDPRDHPSGFDDDVILEYGQVRDEVADLTANRFHLANADVVRVEWLDGEDG